jgi:hypothetical protein
LRETPAISGAPHLQREAQVHGSEGHIKAEICVHRKAHIKGKARVKRASLVKYEVPVQGKARF